MSTTSDTFVADLVDEAASLPTVAARVVALTSDPHGHMDELAKAIRTDGAMTLRFLALANSAAFSRGVEIVDLRMALVRLGTLRVRNVALLMGAHDLLPAGKTITGFDPAAYWRHGIATAAWMQALAQRTGGSPDDAWLVGILHGIGVAALARRTPDTLESALTLARSEILPLSTALQRICGCHQGDIGEGVLARWQLPQALCAVIGRHADDELPPDLDGPTRELVDMLRRAMALARAGNHGDSGDGTPPPAPGVAARRADLDEMTHEDLTATVTLEVEELVKAFGLDDDGDAAAAAAHARLPLVQLGLAGLDASLGKQRLEKQLHDARGIQQRLLPKNLPDLPGLDIAAANTPSLHVSGDLYDFLPACGGRTAFVVADVVGKGTPAALLAAHLQATLRALAAVHEDVGDLMTAANTSLVEATDDEHFATVFMAIVDLDGSGFDCVSAGHVPPLLLPRDGRLRWHGPQGPPLGMLPGAAFRSARIELAPGDRFVVVTDGVLEAPAADGGEFRAAALAAAVAAGGPTAAGIIDAVHAAVAAHTGTSEAPADDLTLLVVCRGN